MIDDPELLALRTKIQEAQNALHVIAAVFSVICAADAAKDVFEMAGRLEKYASALKYAEKDPQ